MFKGYHFISRSLLSGGLAIFFIVFLISGCRTVSTVQSESETRKEAQEALAAVAGALSGKTLNEEDLRHLEKQIREDKEAQTAIQAITESVGGKPPIVKYCPITGQRYASYMEECPEHHVPLKVVDQ